MNEMLNSAEEKIRLLAMADPTMQSIFGSGPMRWFHLQLTQGYIQKGTCLTAQQVSAAYLYAQEGILCIEQCRLTFRCWNADQTAAVTAMNAVNQFLNGVDLMSAAQFTSPPTTPRQYPSYKLSTRPGVQTQLEREIYTWESDWRIFNNTLVT